MKNRFDPVRSLAIIVILGTLAFTSCVFRKIPALSDFLEHREGSEVTQVKHPLFPEQFRAIHRLNLKIREKTYDLTGYFLMRQPADYYASAFLEAGSSVFAFQHTRNQGFAVLEKPGPLPQYFLVQGAAPDLLHIFSNKARGDGEGPAHYIYRDGELTESFVGDGLGVCLRVSYGDYRRFESMGGISLPQQITLINHCFPYEAELRLVEISSKLPRNFETLLKTKAKE